MSRAMKDSGIPWIGEIPEGWEVDKVFRIFKSIGSGTTPSSSDDSAYGGTINWIQSGDINGGNIHDVLNKITEQTLNKYPALYVYEAPFIIIAMYGASVGNISISLIDGCVNQACCVLSKSGIHFKYVFYSLKSAQDYLIYKAVGGGQPNISQKTIKQLWLPVPPVAEQEAIAEFLDRKCGEVDAMVSLQEQVIEELKAYKQSVITEAVTKGLNPSAPMKPTNIDWIGQIPSHWEIPKLGTLFMIKAGGDAKPALYSDTLDELHKYPVYTNAKYSDQIYAYSSIALFPGNSITVTGRGDIGHAIYRDSPFDAIIRLLVLQPKNSSLVDSRYYTYFIDNVIHFFSDSAGVGQLSALQISPYKVAYPPLSEQQEIADYLDRKCADIDALIALKQQKIEELKQYKKSLIYEYVTGKKTVPCGG